jgi:hypothetical protein
MADQESGQTDGNAFDELAAAMPRIAEALKDLPESVQGKAFDALVATFTEDALATTQGGGARKRRRTATRKAKTTGEKTTTTTRRGSAGSPTMVKDLDLAPTGKTSFKDFIAEKSPMTQHDRSVVSVYWLSQIAGVSRITVSDIFTCYRHAAGWKVPANLANGLAVTANRKGFFDTSDLQDIKLKPHGINRVEHELPKKPKA